MGKIYFITCFIEEIGFSWVFIYDLEGCVIDCIIERIVFVIWSFYSLGVFIGKLESLVSDC